MAEIVVKLVNGELAGKTAQSIAKEITNAAQAAKKAEVGTKDWIDATQRLSDAKALQEDYNKQLKSTNTASDLLKKSFSGFPGAELFSRLSSGAGELKGGVGGLTSQFGVLKGAIAATGFGLILIAVTALINVFKTFTPVVDKVEQILGGISAVVDELQQRFQSFGAGLLKIITGTPGGVDQLASSFDGLTDSVSKAYDAGEKLAQLQQDLDDANRGIAISNAKQEAQVDKLILQSKNRSATTQQQIDLLNEARKVAEENFNANNDLDKKNLDALLQDAQLKSKLSKDEILQLAEGTLSQETEYAKRGKISDELLQKITDAQVKVISQESKTNSLLEKITNREAAIKDKQQAADEKAAAARAKQREKELADEQKKKEEEEKYWDKYYADVNKLEEEHVQAMEDSRAKDMASLQLQLKKEIEALDTNSPLYAEQLSVAQELARKKRNDVNKKWDKIEDDQRKEALEKELHDIEKNGNDIQLALLEQFANQEIDADQYEQAKNETQAQVYEQQLDDLEAHGQKQSEQYKQIYGNLLNLTVQNNQKMAASDKQRFSATLGAASTFVSALESGYQADVDAQQARADQAKDIYGEESDEYKKQQDILNQTKKDAGEKKKRLDKVQVGINLITEVSSIWSTAAELGPIAGPILGAILTAAAVIRANAAVKQIDAQQYKDGGQFALKEIMYKRKKYASGGGFAQNGGLAVGPSHDNGGIPGFIKSIRQPIEFEGGEFLFSKKATDRLGVHNLSALNNQYTKMATGGPLNPLTDKSREPIPNSDLHMQDTGLNSDTKLGAIKQSVDNLAQAVINHMQATDGRFDRIQVVNNLQDVQKGLSKLNQIKAEADI